jgi:hypothetical protein
MPSQRDHLSCGVLLQLVGRAPADILQHVELAGAQRRQAGRLVLDGAVDDLVDERQLVLDSPSIFSLSQ